MKIYFRLLCAKVNILNKGVEVNHKTRGGYNDILLENQCEVGVKSEWDIKASFWRSSGTI